ncbi:hypothetical protein EXIGLDRAFT_48266 [Exidia glandulosa HHB12029]|uniref:Uncharacterized protein n=1 Tax=Exidia glandulosa HHB12029 TaxID=1314781 RepID=A0A166BJS2_EXIGL|nr:hypothetical protein EXIGLDRAFT_48266 [Exidia glandulosa HHB12029]
MLEVLFWLAWDLVPGSGPVAVQPVKTPYETDLGRKLLLEDEGAQIPQDVESVRLVLLVEAFNLEKVLEDDTFELVAFPQDASTILSAPQQLTLVHDLVVCANDPRYSPITLAWACVLFRPHPAAEEQDAIPENYPSYRVRARVCHQLELEYSRWSEDRPTQRARSPAERDAFQLSVYRLWLFSLFCSDDCSFQDASNDDLFSDPGFRAKIFYAAYTAREIHNLHAIIDWMREVIGRYWSTGSMSSRPIRMRCIVGGPQTVLDIIETPHQCCTILEAVRGLVYAGRQGCAGDPRFIYEARTLSATTAAVNAIPAGIDRRIITPDLYEPLCWKYLTGPGVPLFSPFSSYATCAHVVLADWENSPLDLRIDDSLPN